MRTIIKTIGIGIAMAGIVYLGMQAYRQRLLLKNSCISVSALKIKNANVNDLWIALSLKIVNKTDFALTIFNKNLVFYIGNQYVGFLNEKNKIEIKAGEEMIIPVDFHIVPIGLLRNINDFGNKVLNISGNIDISTSMLIINKIPINLNIKITNLFGQNSSTIQC